MADRQHGVDILGWFDVGSAIVATYSFAVALPLFNLLRENPEFFIARGFSAPDYLFFALGLALLVPGTVVGLIVAIPSPTFRSKVLFAIVGVLVGLLALQVMRSLPITNGVPIALSGLASVALGSAGVLAIRRWDSVRSFLRVCLVLPLILILMFLLSEGVVDARSTADSPRHHVDIGNPIPVVFVVFDELPLTSLLRTDGMINETRFPNFARLAEHTTWFRNAFANSPSTTQSVPAILTGQYPQDSNPAPVHRNYPDNLFGLVGGVYSIVGRESVTMLCPGDICNATIPFSRRWSSLPNDVWQVFLHLTLPEAMTASLQPIDEDWANFGDDREPEDLQIEETRSANKAPSPGTPAEYEDRRGSFSRFVEKINATEGPVLYFRHSLVPHRPWQYLPSGQTYHAHPRVPGTDRSVWTDQEFLVDQGFQRHLLQVGAADRMVGQLIDKLEDEALLGEALIVVTADHGIAFRPGQAMRGDMEDSIGSVGAVPLFVTLGADLAGVTVDAPVELVDVLPTIALALEADVDWAFDGVPLQITASSPNADGRPVFTFPGGVGHVDAAERRREETMNLALRYDLDGDWKRLLQPSLGSDLVGRPLDDVAIGSPLDWAVVVESLEMLNGVDLGSESVPALIEGWVSEGGEEGSQYRMALALNGTISAVFETFDQARGDMISVLVPPSRLRDGSNQLELFLIDGPGTVLRPVLDIRSAE